MPLEFADTRSERRMWAPSRGRVLQLVSRASGFPADELIGQGRYHDLCRARHVGFWLMRRYGYSMGEIGATFGGRDHTTVLSGIRRVEYAIKTGNASFAVVIEAVLTAALDMIASELGLPTSKPNPEPEATAPPPAAPSAPEPVRSAAIAPMTPAMLDRARQMRRRGATLKGTAKALGVDPLALALALGERIRNDMSPSHSNSEKVLV